MRLPVLDGLAHPEPVRATDHLLEPAETHPGHELPHLFGEEEEIVDDLLGRTLEELAELGVLRGDADRARVQMTDPHHDAAGRHERGCRERELLAAEKRRHHHVAARLELAVGLEDDAPAQVVPDEDLLGLGETQLPRQARVLYGGERGSPGAAVVARDGYVVGLRLGHAGRHRANPDLGDELHAHVGRGVGVLEVMDELGEVLDGVDIVVGRG